MLERGKSARSARIAMSAALLAGVACSRSSPPEPPRNPLLMTPTDVAEISLPAPTTADLLDGVRRSNVVVAAEVLRLQPVSSQAGAPCAQQGVTYRVEEVLHGVTSAGTLNVAHPVCLGRPLIDNRLFALSRAYFEPGRRMVLFLERDESGRVRYSGDEWVSDYWVFDERVGVLLDSDEVREHVRRASAASGGPRGGGEADPFTGHGKRGRNR